MATMQLDFTQAMKDFKTMFPDMDDDVIEAVLRANQGAVDATIDQLLAMSTDNQNEKLRNDIDQVETVADKTPRHNKRLVQSNGVTTLEEVTNEIDPNDESIPLAKRRNWIPRLLGPLPSSFLRIPPPNQSDLCLELEDEKIAMFLQNEEFMAELRWNQEFMSALDSEQGRDAKKGQDDEAAFKERLKNMGKVSRRKFAQVTRMFSWQGGKKPASKPHRDSLPLREEHSDDERTANSSNVQK